MRQRRLLRAIFLSSSLLWFGSAASADILNGDFHLGGADFGSGYTAVLPATSTSCWPEGTYAIVTNPIQCHYLWSPFLDRTGSGNIMVVNGATVPNVTVWSQTETALQTNTEYYFSIWTASVYPASPAELQLMVNGSNLGSAFTLSGTTGQWHEYYGSWYSGSHTSASLSIVDLNTVASGNDFALDDLHFGKTNPGGTYEGGTGVPEPGSWMLLGPALAALLWGARLRPAKW